MVMYTILGRLLSNIFLGSKMGPFRKRQKNIILCDSKRSSFITDFFELQFDTVTLIIPSFRMIDLDPSELQNDTG